MSDPINIRVIDFETSDLPEKGGVVIEAAWGKVLYRSDSPPFAYTPSYARYGLPEGRRIDPAAQAAHHIWEYELAGKPPFQSVDAVALIHEQDSGRMPIDYVAAHHIEFERNMLLNYIPILDGNVKFICTEKCARHIFPGAGNWNLQYLRYYLNLEEGEKCESGHPAHSAFADVFITQLLLVLLLDHKTPEELYFMTTQPVHYPLCPIGKYKGQPWSEVDTGMLNWMLYKAQDMDPDIKAAARNELFFRQGR